MALIAKTVKCENNELVPSIYICNCLQPFMPTYLKPLKVKPLGLQETFVTRNSDGKRKKNSRTRKCPGLSIPPRSGY